MPSFEALFAEASQLPVDQRLRLIEALSESVSEDSTLLHSEEWRTEIDRRSREMDAGNVVTEDWSAIRDRLFKKHGVRDAS